MAADHSAGAQARLARYYDLDLIDHTEDVDLYLALAGSGGQDILELGVGSGRLAIPLAQARHQVVGVDSDPQMLDRARTRWAATSGLPGGSLDLLQADLRQPTLGRQFDLVILGLNMLPVLPDRASQVQALSIAAAHVKSETGRVVIDTTLPTPAELASWDGTLSLAWQRTDPETGDTVAKLWSTEFDQVEGVAVVTTYFDWWPAEGGPVQRIDRRDELHLLTLNELESLVEQAGMRVVEAAGDYAMAPLGAGSERAVLVCSLL